MKFLILGVDYYLNLAGQARYSNFTKMLERFLGTLKCFQDNEQVDNDAELKGLRLLGALCNMGLAYSQGLLTTVNL